MFLSSFLNTRTLWCHHCRMLSQLSDTEPCSGLQFNSGSCLAMVEKCYSPQFSAEMKDFFLERAIQFKQWMVLAKKLLDITHAKSVFYFFSPFLLQFCLMNELKWYHIFYEECLHVKRWARLMNEWIGGEATLCIFTRFFFAFNGNQISDITHKVSMKRI